MLQVLLERSLPPGVSVVNARHRPGGAITLPGTSQLITALRRVKLEDMRNSQRLNVTLSNVFQSLIARMCFRAKLSAPCVLAGLKCHVHLLGDDSLEVMASAMCIPEQRSQVLCELALVRLPTHAHTFTHPAQSTST